jgi:uncharacterized protein (DUF1800 family)
MGKFDFSKDDLIHVVSERHKKIRGETKDFLFEEYSRKSFQGRNIYPEGPDFNQTDEPSSLRVGSVTSGLTPFTGTWNRQTALHLLRRTGYGYKKAHADLIQAMTMSNAVDLILTMPATPAPPPINWYQSIQPDQSGVPYGADWTTTPINDFVVGFETNIHRSEGVKHWMTGLALNQDISIREKMTAFWYHFIPVDFNTVLDSNNEYCATNSARICFQYMKLFRDNCIGNYKSLIRQMAVAPAMMYYLNNQANNLLAPDENFAREIMELFTLGKGPESQYTQADVVQAARVLTGWRVENLNTALPTVNFNPALHDFGSKQFSSFYNNTIIEGTGASELDTFIDMIFSKSKIVSEYIVRRLYRFFVYYDIDANVEANVIVPLAQIFVSNNWEVLPVLKALFKSQHFYDMANRGVYIKSPYDLLVGTCRIFNLQTTPADPNDHFNQYYIWLFLNYVGLSGTNQVLGEVPNVSGWPAFYQVPNFHQIWINSITTQVRFSWMTAVIFGLDIRPDAENFAARLEINEIQFFRDYLTNTQMGNPNTVVNTAVDNLLCIGLSTAERNKLKTEHLLFNLTGGFGDLYWTSAWNNYLADTSNETNRNIVRFALKGLLYSIIGLPEYQLA